jgi:6-phosphogluconolactonase
MYERARQSTMPEASQSGDGTTKEAIMARSPRSCGNSISVGGLKKAWLGILGAFVALTASAPTLAVAGVASGGSHPIGAVYVASNAYSGNAILAFPRYADGSLGPVQPGVPTGGLGSGPGLLLPDDPLGAQSSLIVDQGSKLLFVVNAGSDDVSVFSINGNSLALVGRQPSGGGFPVSLALFDHTLYVLNAVGNSVAGFRVDARGHLRQSLTCALPSLPNGADPVLAGTATQSPQPVMVQTAGQVGFSPDGTRLLVVSKEGPLLREGFPFTPTLGAGRIHVYDVGGPHHSLLNCGNPTTTVLSSNGGGGGKMPFSFGWTAQGQLVLLEVFGSSTTFGGGAVSSYALSGDDTLAPISTSVPNGGTAPCWIVRSRANLYVANNLSNASDQPNSITRYVVNSKGQLAPNPAVAAPIGSSLTDMTITTNGRFIYQLAPGSAQVWPFSVGSTGALTGLGSVADGQPEHSGQAGIATIDF